MWREGWIRLRNAALADARFQRLALRFAPTRPVARAHARRLFDVVAGFTYAQTLVACVELDLFGRLGGGPVQIDRLARDIVVPMPALERLIDAAAALDLLERLGGGRVALGVAGAALAANPGVAAMVRHHRHLYADLADPVALLRRPGGGQLAAFWGYARGNDPQAVEAYSTLMATSVDPVAEELLASYDVRRHSRLLDIGGGEGRFLAAVHDRAPRLRLGLFDLPAVTARAEGRLGGVAALHSGDFRTTPLPQGYDCITLVRVLHDHDDAVALDLLRAVRRALAPGGTLVIAEPMADAPGAERVGAVYFAWYLLAMGTGRARSIADIGAMLKAAGFDHWHARRTRLPLHASVMVGK